MASAKLWSFALQVQSKNSGGTIQHTYVPLGMTSAQTPTGVSIEIEHEPVSVERELVDYSRDDIQLGYRRHYRVTLTILANALTCASGKSDLEVVLSDMYVLGNYLEISTNGGTGFVKCYVSEDSGPQKLDGKPVGITREITFSTCALLTTDASVGSLD